MSAQVTKAGFLSMQVCVPAEWTDNQIKDFAYRDNPCGTSNGWIIRRTGDDALAGASERVTCLKLNDHVHVMLDA